MNAWLNNFFFSSSVVMGFIFWVIFVLFWISCEFYKQSNHLTLRHSEHYISNCAFWSSAFPQMILGSSSMKVGFNNWYFLKRKHKNEPNRPILKPLFISDSWSRLWALLRLCIFISTTWFVQLNIHLSSLFCWTWFLSHVDRIGWQKYFPAETGPG